MSQIISDMFRLLQSQSRPFLIIELSQVCNNNSTTGATTGAGNAHPSRAPAFASDFCEIFVAQSYVFCVVFHV